MKSATTGKEKTVLYKDRLMPTTTALQARLQMFESTRSPTWRTREITTPWGQAKVTGRLGTMHAALLEAIMFFAIKQRDLEGGGVQVLVDPYAIRTALGERRARERAGDNATKQKRRRGTAWGGYSSTGIRHLAEDLRMAAISLTTSSGEWMLDGLLYRIEASKAIAGTSVCGERRLWKITLSPTTARLFRKDLALHYDPRPIAALRSGVAASAARWVLTHRTSPPGGWHIDTVLAAVGAETEGAAARNRRRELRKEADALAACGVIVGGDRVKKTESVFSTPTGVLSTPTKLESVFSTPTGVLSTPTKPGCV